MTEREENKEREKVIEKERVREERGGRGIGLVAARRKEEW